MLPMKLKNWQGSPQNSDVERDVWYQPDVQTRVAQVCNALFTMDALENLMNSLIWQNKKYAISNWSNDCTITEAV